MKTTILLGVTIATALAGEGALAQTHTVTAPDTVVRAVGVYEWTGDLAKPTGSRLVPVSVFIDGQLQDAGIYMPRPVPFALVSGNVYELEDAGLAKGTVELESAIHMMLPEGSPGAAFDEGWMGYGSYRPAVSARKSASTLKPAKTLPVITTSSSDSSRPHFSNKSDDTSKTGSSAGSQQQDTSKKTDSGSTSDDPDRPTMKRRDSSDTTASSTGSASSGGSSQTTSSDDDAERPTLKRRTPEDEKDAKDNKKKNDIATVSGTGSLNDDPDRPTLHHGSSGSGSATDMPKLMGIPRDMHQMVAVSDAKDRDPHPFARPWEDDKERAAVLTKMQNFARAKLTEYGVVPGVTPPSAIAGTSPAAASASTSGNKEPEPPTLKRGVPTSAKTTTHEPSAPASPAATKTPATSAKTATAGTKSRRPASANAPQVVLADEELKGYLLSYGGAPTYVYMAHTVETGSVMRYVTVIAQADAVGDLKLALASATDAAHLDRTPWMRLVDAVDVEASNRASLLFEMRGQTSRQFALYRVIATKPEQIFQTGSSL